MIICISEELVNLKEELKGRGYNIVEKGNNMPCDAIICNLKNGGLVSENIQNSIRREGTIIIDSGNKTIDEIEYILNNRVYNLSI